MKEYKFKDGITERFEPVAFFCKRWRMANNFSIVDVADATGYSKENIIKFEQGNNNNMMILLWYLLNGLKIENIAAKGVILDEMARDS